MPQHEWVTAAGEALKEQQAKLEAQAREIDTLSRQLATERLRADTGWARYENANMGQKLAREELARVNAKVAEWGMPEPDYEEIAYNRGYTVDVHRNGKYFYFTPTMMPSNFYSTRAECWKAACEDNGLLGERLKPSLSTKGSA